MSIFGRSKDKECPSVGTPTLGRFIRSNAELSWVVAFTQFLESTDSLGFISFLVGDDVVAVEGISFASIGREWNGVRFDAVTSTGSVAVNLELQSYRDRYIAQRGLYHASIMTAIQGSHEGEDYSEFGNTCVVFICSSLQGTSSPVIEMSAVLRDGDVTDVLPYQRVRAIDVSRVRELPITEEYAELLQILSLADPGDRTSRLLVTLNKGGKSATDKFEYAARITMRCMDSAAKNMILRGCKYKFIKRIYGDLGFTYRMYHFLCIELGVTPSGEFE